MTPHIERDIPDFLRIPQDDRRAAWKGRRLRPTREMNFGKAARAEDPATLKLRKEVEAAERARAERKAQEKRDRQSLERRRTAIVKQEIEMAHSTVGPKEAQLRNLRNQTPVRIVKITTIEKPAPIIEAQQETTDMAKTAKKTAKRHPNLPSTHPANRGKAPPKKRAAKKAAAPKAPKAAKTDGTKTIRPGSKLEIVVGLLKRREGCTTAEILAGTGWPSCSVPQQARAAGLTLRQKKEGRTTRYWAA